MNVLNKRKKEKVRKITAGNREKVDFKQGWNALSLKLKITYLLLCLFALIYHLICLVILPSVLKVPMLFQAYSVVMPSWLYLMSSYAILLFFIYLDCTNETLSKVKGFLPLVIFAADMYFVSDFFMK